MKGSSMEEVLPQADPCSTLDPIAASLALRQRGSETNNMSRAGDEGVQPVVRAALFTGRKRRFEIGELRSSFDLRTTGLLGEK
jgi:hypothetical protein